MYKRVRSLSAFRVQPLMFALLLCLGGFGVASGQTNNQTPVGSDRIRERISAVIQDTIKQGEGYTAECIKFWTRVPPSNEDVQEIKAYGDRAVPILEEYLYSDVGREGNLALEILGRLVEVGLWSR